MNGIIILDGEEFYPKVNFETKEYERFQQDWEKDYLKLSNKLLSYVASASDGRNTVCSPYSLYILLALALNATGGSTQKEIKELIAPGYWIESFNMIMKDVQMEFNKQMKGGKLVSSNGICVENDMYDDILDGFRNLVNKMYDAEIFKAGDDVAHQINDWVNKKTYEMIPKLLDKIPEDFKVCLMNAIAFEAKWKTPYEDGDIYDDDFTNADGSVSEISFMSSTENLYIEDDYFTGFIKDYKGGRYALMALLPKQEDGTFLEKGIAQIDFYKYYKNAKYFDVYVEMPEFECEESQELTEFCMSMGLKSMFTTHANFTGITKSKGLKVDSIMQKAVIKVNRAGTKAAAVTAMMCPLGCPPDEKMTKYISLNRPFVYAVVNKEYDGLPVFAGVVNRM